MQTIKKVKVWEEQVTIPTYQTAQAEKSPLFIEKRAYQGSTGKVYPLPITEKISEEKQEVSYLAIFLENEYLQLMILPELGGRIQRALDKTNDYDFVYYNHVIKPALVGLTGPWISGGIEFNWPQHHRPSTFSPVDYQYTENKDGSCTVYVSEIDKMYGTKGMGAFTLYPDKAYIEIKGQLFNATDTPQTFLWWANPAVPVNENTYSVFPPDVHAVMDHGKRAVSTFPIATGEYYKYDYSEGIDISRYKNIKVPTSYMAAHSDFDFIGNYDEKLEAGLLHVADHHVSPGKKQWTWGNSDFGLAWDRNLTDEDGPYIELMTGVFTDNQPDFTWLKPYEEKTFTQYFMPYKGVGHVKNATKDAVINYEIRQGKAVIKLYTSGSYEKAEIKVSLDGEILFREQVDLTPLVSYEAFFDTMLVTTAGCIVTVLDQEGVPLVQYKAEEKQRKPAPNPAKRLLPPAELKSTEELYLGALHLEQYRHATYEPADYYKEGLKRDASDLRLNNGYGMLLFKRGGIGAAIGHFEKAIEKQTWKNPNPYYGESYFNLGLALEMAGEEAKAYDAFYKSTWSSETQSGGFYWLACLSSRRQQYAQALEFVDQSLIRNWHNRKARYLKAAILRRLGRDNTVLLQESINIDPLCMGCLYEQARNKKELTAWKKIMRYPAHNYLELSLDYLKGGFYEDAIGILEACEDKTPLVYYYMGYVYTLTGAIAKAEEQYRLGEAANPDYCFPNKVIEIKILKSAIAALEKAPFAHYYLGNLFYDKKQYEEAGNHWEISYAENASYAMTCRNLAIYYYNKQGNSDKAMHFMKIAYELEPDYARFLLEYDQLRARAGIRNKERLELLEARLELVKTRDVLYLEYITLLSSTGEYDKAIQCLLSHSFHPWEGGEGRVSTQYRYALTEKALQELDLGDTKKAIELLEATMSYPANLGEGKLPNTQDNIANYYLGKAYSRLGNHEQAAEYYKKASIGLEEPGSVLYYNDQPADTIFYQGLAHQELGNAPAARKAYHQLLAFGEKHLFDQVEYDYFAVSLPEIEVFADDIQLRNEIYCNYLIGLGYLGLGKLEAAEQSFDRILEGHPNDQGAIRHKRMLKRV